MSLFVFHQKLTARELDEAAAGAKRDIAAWYKANPKRRVCNAQFWYGRMYKIRKGHIEADIDAARKDADK